MKRLPLTLAGLVLCCLPLHAQQAGQFGGGVPSQQVAPNPGTVQVSFNCGGQSNCVQLVDSPGFEDNTCTWTNTSATVTCTDAPFTAAMADGNWRAAGFSTCSTNAAAYTNSLGSQAGTTIATYISATQVTLSNPATATQSTAACFIAAPLEDTALAAANTLANNAITCQKIKLAFSGIIAAMTPNPFVKPTACKNLPEDDVSGGSNDSPTFTVEGEGMGVTKIWGPPDFANSLANCTFGLSGTACFLIDFTLYRDWGFTGGGLSLSGISTAHHLFEMSYFINPTWGNGFGFLDHFACTNFGLQESNLFGLYSYGYHTTVRNSNFDGCGGSASGASAGPGGVAAGIVAWSSAFEDSAINEWQAGTAPTGFAGHHVSIAAGRLNAANRQLMQGGSVILYDGSFMIQNNDPNALRCYYGSSSDDSLTLQDSTCNATTGITIQGSTPNIYLRNSSITNGIQFLSGAYNLYDLGGPNTIGTIGGTPNVFGSLSITGTAQTTGNIVPSSGFGVSASVSVTCTGCIAGDSHKFAFQITNGASGTGANPTVAITFPKAYWAAPVCQIPQQIGGTNPVLPVTLSVLPSTTGLTMQVTGTPTASDTEIYSVSCQ